MAQDLERIAQGMRDATKDRCSVRLLTDFLEPLWGDEVTVSHEPAIDGFDGVRSREELVAMERAQMEGLLKMMPDMWEEIGGIRIQDDTMTFTAARGWTGPDGAPVHTKAALMEFGFRDGRIHRMGVWLDPAMMEMS